jgi:pantoate--beta-alanine ligase
MKQFHTPAAMQQWSLAERAAGHRIAVVPTMGALHEGHLTLIDEAKHHADRVIVTLFVNPIQFNRPDDFSKYPRTVDDDAAQCRARGVAALYLPTPEVMYPPGYETYVHPGSLADYLCGAGRPGHFRGVTTVVTKLFNATQPHAAVFGQKDFQQLAIIRRMTVDLDFPVEVIGVPTVREADGLAMSSRNVRLSPVERQAAACIPRALKAAEAAVRAGERSAAVIAGLAAQEIGHEPLARIEYLDVRDPSTLESVHHLHGPTLLATATWVGDVRLIDNIVLEP